MPNSACIKERFAVRVHHSALLCLQVIRGLATGKIDNSMESVRKSMTQQVLVGLLLGSALSAGGFVRVYLTNGDLVLVSVILGSGLPFALSKVGVDPANAGTSIQVVMDVLGVAITCVTCDFIFRELSSTLL
jgi:Mg/Co/Ni transporter MgtE